MYVCETALNLVQGKGWRTMREQRSPRFMTSGTTDRMPSSSTAFLTAFAFATGVVLACTLHGDRRLATAQL